MRSYIYKYILISAIPGCCKEPVRLDNHLPFTQIYQTNLTLMKYTRTNFLADSLNSFPEEEEGELSTSNEE